MTQCLQVVIRVSATSTARQNVIDIRGHDCDLVALMHAKRISAKRMPGEQHGTQLTPTRIIPPG